MLLLNWKQVSFLIFQQFSYKYDFFTIMEYSAQIRDFFISVRLNSFRAAKTEEKPDDSRKLVNAKLH